MEEDLTFEEAAKKMGVSVERIAQWANAGVLVVRGFGGAGTANLKRLVPAKAVDELMLKLNPPPPEPEKVPEAAGETAAEPTDSARVSPAA
jgi:hypothetical protein